MIDNLRIPPQVEINHVRARARGEAGRDDKEGFGRGARVRTSVRPSAFVHVMSIPAVNAVNA